MLKQSTFIYEIEQNLNHILKDKNLQEWCDEISQDFLRQTLQSSPPFSLKPLLSLRKAKLKQEEWKLVVNGRIYTDSNGFIIEVSDKVRKAEIEYFRYVLAHEIGHTYFYDLSKSPPKNISGFPLGSKYIEFLCNLIARNLIIPTSALKKVAREFPKPDEPDFSLIYINELAKAFGAKHYLLLERLIKDTGIWNCVFVRFKLNYETEKWELHESYKPPQIFSDKKYFIPSKFQKYPTAKRKLETFLFKNYGELKDKKRISLYLNKDSLDEKPLNNFVKNYYSKKEILVHLSADYQRSIINMCLPL